MKLHLVYRLYGGENLKGRPSFYSKRTSLASFLQAAEAAEADTVVLADGPIPGELREMASRQGRVVDLPGGPVGMRNSYLAALRYPKAAHWADDDLVYFSEDDYLHDSDAFISLVRAAAAIPPAGYFALYGSTPQHPALGQGVPLTFPADWAHHPDVVVGRQKWTNVPSTASTFGARVGTLRADLGIFRQGMLPYRTRLLDHETCVVYQGRFPYTPTELVLGPAATRFRSGLAALASNAVLTPFRLAFAARALTRRRHPHLLYAADPNLACHMETQFMSPGVDWLKRAESAQVWAEQAGFNRSATGQP